MPSTIRCFIAILISPAARQGLLAVQNHFKKAGADVKWVKEPNIHITLRFLGDRPPKKVKAVTDFLHKSFSSHEAFEIEIDRLGVFPSERFPKVLWAGVGQNSDRIAQIAGRLEEELNRLGSPKERQEFIPHVTLGRVQSAKNVKPLMQKFTGYTFSSPILSPLNQIIFYQSTLTPAGPVYEPLTTVDLKP